MSNVLEAIRAWLDAHQVSYVVKQHEPTFTSEQSAQARGEPLSIGAKALVVKADDRHWIVVLPADRKLDSAALKRHLGIKKLRFAAADELLALTGLVPGSVPPFGQPILPLELLADPALGRQTRIAFNAGSLTTSIIMAFADYQRVCGAQWVAVALEA